MRAAGRETDVSGHQQEELTRALRALLLHPLLDAQRDGELFRLVRRHIDVLRAWLDRETGWRLNLDSQTVRLLPAYVPLGPTAEAIAERHSARARRGDPPFTRRRYVLLCLALAVLERSDPQISLGHLAEEVVLTARRPELESIDFSMTGREERADLVAAIRLLLRYGVLDRVAGDEEAYVSSGGDALYDVDRRVLSTMLSASHGPALVGASLGEQVDIGVIEAALHEPPPAYTDEEALRRLRHSVSRRLLSDPVVYYDELREDERAYLIGQRVQLTQRLAQATGLVPEMRAEGIAMVDPEDQLSDVRMPEQGTDGHATLLLAEYLAEAGPTDVAALRRRVRRFATEYGNYWRRAASEPGAENAIVAGAVDRLVALGLARVAVQSPAGETDPIVGSGQAVGSGVLKNTVVEPLPALRRFALGAPTMRERKAG